MSDNIKVSDLTVLFHCGWWSLDLSAEGLTLTAPSQWRMVTQHHAHSLLEVILTTRTHADPWAIVLAILYTAYVQPLYIRTLAYAAQKLVAAAVGKYLTESLQYITIALPWVVIYSMYVCSI